MEPKEKAESLINMFSPHVKDWDYFNDVPLDKNYAKECALIAVDEILNSLDYDYILFKQQSEYWQQVKQKIEKL